MLVCISKLSSNCYQGIEIGYACTKEKAEQIAHAIFNRLTGMTQLVRTKCNLGIEHCWKHPRVFALGCALCIALALLVWKFWPTSPPPQNCANEASIPEITIKIAETKLEPNAPPETAPPKLEQTMVPPRDFGSTDTSLVEIASPPPVTCELDESDNKN